MQLPSAGLADRGGLGHLDEGARLDVINVAVHGNVAWHERMGTQEQKVTLGEKDTKEIASRWALNRRFVPELKAGTRNALYDGWKTAVKRVR